MARQERGRGESEERERVRRLIREYRARLANLVRAREEIVVEPDDVLNDLERAVAQGWQQLPRDVPRRRMKT